MTRLLQTILKYVFILHFLFRITDLNAQSAQGKVNGKVIEMSSGEPIGYVVISLRQLPDSNVIQSLTTNDLGHYAFTNVVPGDYIVEANLIGFSSSLSPSFKINANESISAPVIRLTVSDFLLAEIEIAASNPAYVNAIDRKIYYPGNDINARSGTASEALQNIPSITVESEGEILMRGSPNVTFLLNGKTSPTLKNNASTVLEQIPAHLIERIEVITNPSAKFKPDGTSGIINIITKKNVLTGFNGTVLANASTQERFNGNLSLNYNPGKINFATSYGYWQSYSPRTVTDNRMITDPISGSTSSFLQDHLATGRPKTHTSSFTVDYTPNTKNSYSLATSYFKYQSTRKDEIHTKDIRESSLLTYSTTRNEKDDENEIEISLTSEHLFKKEDHTLSLEAGYSYFDELEDSDFTDDFNSTSLPDLRGRNNIFNTGNVSFVSVDYTNPFTEEMEFESGYEGEFSKEDIDFKTDVFDFTAQQWKADVAKTNRFLFRQDIHAIYATLSRQFGSFTTLGGLRAEQTSFTSELIQLDSVVPNEYFKLFPTLHTVYEISDNQELTLNYSRRINRPDADELNPFPEYVDIRDIEAGNPNLKPEQVHSLELGYQHQSDAFTFSPVLYYRHTYDAFSDVSYYINDTVLFTTIQNVSKSSSEGLELVFSWSPSNKWDINLNSNLFHQTIDASNLGYDENKSIISVDSKLSAHWQMGRTTKLQLNGTYRSASLSAQGRSLPVYFINTGIKQDLFKRTASLTLSVSDIMNTMKWRYVIDTPTLYQEVTRKRKSQIIYLGFSWRFGISGKKNGEELLFEDRM